MILLLRFILCHMNERENFNELYDEIVFVSFILSKKYFLLLH